MQEQTGAGSDPVFEMEQERLTRVYALIVRKLEETHVSIRDLEKEVAEEKEKLSEDMALNYDSDTTAMETYAEFEVLNRAVDAYNIERTSLGRRAAVLARLKKSPYFARISIRRGPSGQVRDLYIGPEGFMDDDNQRLIVDWRAPVAELYYNQENGPTSYTVDGRTIRADLLLRRQLKIREDALLAWFDTTVALEDPLLIESLSRRHTSEMQDITATIQKEQNAVIRHKDVGCLLVRGIAGSGKTSVLLQRIAYLFFRNRETLKPDEVCLITLNPVFRRYIRRVLPGMGETNPRTLIWKDFLQMSGSGGDPADTECGEDFASFPEAMGAYEPTAEDFVPVRNGEERVFSAGEILDYCRANAHFPLVGTRMGVVRDLLEERLFEKEAHKFKGSENKKKKRVESEYASALSQIRSLSFVRTDRMARHILGREDLTGAELCAARLLLTGTCDKRIRYVMIDEIQDYTAAQLMAIRAWFPAAKYMLLGDENQTIAEGRATMDQVRRIFRTRKEPSELSLLTSYRSSPEITALFTSLMEDKEAVRVRSVRRPGEAPLFRPCRDRQEWESCLAGTLEELEEKEGLTGILCAQKKTAERASALLGDRAVRIRSESGRLPVSGAVILDLPLAKGLEFDRVILADAGPDSYPDSLLGRHRLYTAVSRATHRIALLSEGPLTPLLK